LVDLIDCDIISISQEYQSDCGLASADPPSMFTGTNGILCDMKFVKSYESAKVRLISPEMYYYPLYSGWTFLEYPFLFRKPTEATSWAMLRFKRDGLGSLWEPLDYPVFLKFVGRVTISNSDIVRVSSPTSSSKIEDCFFRGVQFYLPKNDHIVLDTDYIQICPEMFHQCIYGFRCAPPDYQFSASSIYINKDECSCQNMKLDRIMKTYNHTLQ
jgi:hypothetical protein